MIPGAKDKRLTLGKAVAVRETWCQLKLIIRFRSSDRTQRSRSRPLSRLPIPRHQAVWSCSHRSQGIRCSRYAKTIAMRRLLSQSPCACRQPIRDSATRAEDRVRVSRHPSPLWRSIHTRQRESQIDPIYNQGRSWHVPPDPTVKKRSYALWLRHGEHHYAVEVFLFASHCTRSDRDVVPPRLWLRRRVGVFDLRNHVAGSSSGGPPRSVLSASLVATSAILRAHRTPRDRWSGAWLGLWW